MSYIRYTNSCRIIVYPSKWLHTNARLRSKFNNFECIQICKVQAEFADDRRQLELKFSIYCNFVLCVYMVLSHLIYFFFY